MRKIIIVAPHFAPSNLAGVHRSRLFAQHLADFDWEPIIVTVHHDYYTETLDPNLSELISPDLRIERVKAIPVKPIKIIGDIGIRGFYQLYKRIISLIKKEKIDFLYITIPSHFAALLGPLVHKKTGIKYGIDYIDPWVHEWPGTEIKLSRHWWSMKIATWFEPFAVKNASLITGVAPKYYEDVFKRNPRLQNTAIHAAMPYGAEINDHKYIKTKNLKPYLFEKKTGVFDFLYAGAFLPKSRKPVEEIFKSIIKNKNYFKNTRFHFIGTGTSPDDALGFNLKALAEQYGLWQNIVFEYPKRIPYLDVLLHLEAADGAFILGSTEAHYTPSKVFQSVLSNKPILAILHQESTACETIVTSNTGVVLAFNGEKDVNKIHELFLQYFLDYKAFFMSYDDKKINKNAFEKYTAKNVTKELVNALNKVTHE